MTPSVYTASPSLLLVAELLSLLDRMADGDAEPVSDSEYDALRAKASRHLADHGLQPVKGAAA